jgi:hypothetical protein
LRKCVEEGKEKSVREDILKCDLEILFLFFEAIMNWKF